MVNTLRDRINHNLVTQLGLRPYTLDKKGIKRNQRQNALARVTATAQLLRQYAIYNGAYPPRTKDVNFGFIRAEIDGVSFTYAVEVKDGVLTVMKETKTYPVMLMDAYLDSYVNERNQLAVGIVLYYGRILPIMFENNKLTIGNW